MYAHELVSLFIKYNVCLLFKSLGLFMVVLVLRQTNVPLPMLMDITGPCVFVKPMASFSSVSKLTSETICVEMYYLYNTTDVQEKPTYAICAFFFSKLNTLRKKCLNVLHKLYVLYV